MMSALGTGGKNDDRHKHIPVPRFGVINEDGM